MGEAVAKWQKWRLVCFVWGKKVPFLPQTKPFLMLVLQQPPTI